jgi:hypothetical protein
LLGFGSDPIATFAAGDSGDFEDQEASRLQQDAGFYQVRVRK